MSKAETNIVVRSRGTRSTLAHQLTRLRKERGWSQLELAYASGLHRTHVSRLENAAYNVSIDTLDNLAGAFGIHPSALITSAAVTPSGISS